MPADNPGRMRAKSVIVEEVERLRWRIWNGRAKNARRSIDRVRKVMHVYKDERGQHTRSAPSRRLWHALLDVDRYLRGQSSWLINYAKRYRAGLRVGTSITEGTANFLVNRRMNKSQQMRWSRRGADLLLQVRCAVYNGKLGSGLGHRFQPHANQNERLANAAVPHSLDTLSGNIYPIDLTKSDLIQAAARQRTGSDITEHNPKCCQANAARLPDGAAGPPFQALRRTPADLLTLYAFQAVGIYAAILPSANHRMARVRNRETVCALACRLFACATYTMPMDYADDSKAGSGRGDLCDGVGIIIVLQKCEQLVGRSKVTGARPAELSWPTHVPGSPYPRAGKSGWPDLPGGRLSAITDVSMPARSSRIAAA